MMARAASLSGLRQKGLPQGRRRVASRASAVSAYVDTGDIDANSGGDVSGGVSTWQQSGLASWYGGSWHGRPTTSGVRFDQEAMTAAHASLPMGTRVRVVNQDGGRAVVVTINDRPGTL